MGKDSILTNEQEKILEQLGNTDLVKSRFYFTGGTALSEIYLKHRESIDLDFFAEHAYDPQPIFALFTEWSKKEDFSLESQFADPTHIYILTFANGQKLKVDFAHYPYKRLKNGTFYKGLEVDSKFDIAVNKLLLVSSQRTEVKDFVDLFFLLKEFTVWDLLDGVKVKFGVKIDSFILASDFTAVEEFEILPKMLKPLTLDELKDFFRQQAKRLGARGSI